MRGASGFVELSIPSIQLESDGRVMKQSIQEALILILVATGIALVVYTIRPDKIVPTTEQAAEATNRSSVEESASREISLEAAWERFQSKTAVFADSRHRADFEAGHIQGAVHLYAADSDVWLTDFLTATDPMATIITYCDGEACPLAKDLAELLALNGFENVRYLKNGWTRWQEKGFPVE